MSTSTTVATNTAVNMMLLQVAMQQQIAMQQMENEFEITEEQKVMLEFAKRLVGRDVYVFMFNGNNVAGRLLEVRDDALLLADESGEQIISLRYVVRLREHPLDKKGNKKKIVL